MYLSRRHRIAHDRKAGRRRPDDRARGRLVVLVAGAIPGERVRARDRARGEGRGLRDGRSTSSEPSADRRAIGGDPLCGGCLYAHIAYPRQLELKSLVIADAFARIGRLELPAAVTVAPSPEEGYRMRARLHVRGRARRVLSRRHARGLRRAADASAAAGDLRRARRARGMRCSRSALAGIREIELAENLDASHRVVHLDVAARRAVGRDARCSNGWPRRMA